MGLKAVAKIQGAGTGSVTSVATTFPLSGGTITTSGTVAISGTPSTNAALVSVVPAWFKVGDALGFAAFQTAGTSKSNTLFSLVAAGIVHAVKVKQSTAFAGTSITEVTAEVGTAGVTDKYASAYDILAAAGAGVFQLSSALGSESQTGATNILITLRSTGANLSALSAGVLDVWALLSKAP